MSARAWALVALAAVTAVACASLGFWQLRRLEQRRARNASVLSRYERHPVELTNLRGGAGDVEFRRVIVRGAYDTSREFSLANRPRHGSPGVHVVTPLIIGDSAVLVTRGWVYSADASRADLARWREDSARADTGYVRALAPQQSAQPAVRSSHPAVIRRIDADVVRMLPYPTRGYYVVLTGSSSPRPDAPARLDTPVLGEGSHLSYAVQWFAFAAIAIIGAGFVVARSRRGADADSERYQAQ